MKKHKQVSRHEPAKTKVSAVPAGTPVAPSAPEVPAAHQQQATPATGESLAAGSGLSQAKGQSETSGRPTISDVVSAIEPEDAVVPSAQTAVGGVAKPAALPVEPQRGGAGWFIPPQKESGFGRKA